MASILPRTTIPRAPTPFPEQGPGKTFRESCAMIMFQKHMFLKVADVRECRLPILFGLTTALGAFPLFITFKSRSVISAFMEMQFTDSPFSSFPCFLPLPAPWHHHGHLDLGSEGRAGSFPSHFHPPAPRSLHLTFWHGSNGEVERHFHCTHSSGYLFLSICFS